MRTERRFTLHFPGLRIPALCGEGSRYSIYGLLSVKSMLNILPFLAPSSFFLSLPLYGLDVTISVARYLGVAAAWISGIHTLKWGKSEEKRYSELNAEDCPSTHHSGDGKERDRRRLDGCHFRPVQTSCFHVLFFYKLRLSKMIIIVILASMTDLKHSIILAISRRVYDSSSLSSNTYSQLCLSVHDHIYLPELKKFSLHN